MPKEYLQQVTSKTKTMKKLIARLRTSLIFNYDLNYEYDLYLQMCICSGVERVKQDEYDITVVFKNGNTFHSWNSNKYYAWLKDAKIIDNCGKRKYFFGRPSASTMLLFEKNIKGHTNEQYDIEKRLSTLEKNVSDLINSKQKTNENKKTKITKGGRVGRT